MIPSAEETITFSCTSCDVQLTVPVKMAGISGPCPKCGSQITSPAAPAGQFAGEPSLPSFPNGGEPAVPAPGISATPLWQHLPPTVPPPLPAVAEGDGQGIPVPKPPAVASEAGLQPGNFTRSTPLIEPQPAPAYQRRRGLSKANAGRRGALFGALIFGSLALAGAGWFFKDQVTVYWNRALAYFQEPDTTAAGPEVATLLKKVEAATASGDGKAKAPVASNDAKKSASAVAPAPEVKPAPKSQPAASEPDAAAKLVEAAPPAPVLPKPPVEAAPVLVATGPEATPPPVEVTRKPEMPTPAVAKSSKAAQAPMAEPVVDPPVRKALPVEPSETPMKPLKDQLPETLSPVPPVPRVATLPALVEVPAAPKGSEALAASAEEKPVFIKASADAKPAAETLNRFFQAKTWQERLLLTQPQEKVRPLMERYYADNPDGPVRVSSIELIRFEKSPEIGTPLCVFQVSGPDLSEPLPVMVESSPDGWKVDWLTFTEFKDKLLVRFLQKWQDDPARFHVMVRRTHYFDEDVPNLDKKHCFEMMPPTPGYSGFAFVPKGGSLAQTLDRSLGWEVTNVAAVVELRWRKQDKYQWVEITAVPQFNWRSTLPAIPVALPAEPDKLDPDSGGGPALAKPASSAKPPAVAGKK